ncbi:unnamed protein product (macronuclear) [Paramecium tetraurelia]|uniref:Transmembrane protein n=1 Tax=Paramecium tetraurelia TaxID=5888 RepID=A0D692_PARTE|nr:uncharacterized protein GSPATT00039291001 [Paramecium tetraurelia]CAK78559.1 unnamed protein product [Paramecium tetraurelia]|eukprot:XP_001445956.1 hypothetical protein (macronuclear) [Paramecium tetraurelia strain d4-2]
MYIYTSYEKNQPNQPLNYISDSQQTIQTNNTEQFEFEQIQSFDIEYILGSQQVEDSLKRADYISSAYAAMIIENFIILAVILLGLYSELQYWLITKSSNIKDFCYCEMEGVSECNFGCVISQKNELSIRPTYLFYCCISIGAILQIWLNFGILYFRKLYWAQQLILLIVVFSCYALMISTLCTLIAYNFGIGLIYLGWLNAFVIIFCFAFYTMKTKSELNYGIGALFIMSPTIFFLIMFIKINPNYVIFLLLSSLILMSFGFYVIWESKKMLSQQRIIRLSIIEILIGSEFLIAFVNQGVFRGVELLIKKLKK